MARRYPLLLRDWLYTIKESKMRPTSKKITATAATLFTFAAIAMAAPAANAEDYCIVNGAQAAHGCGFPTMEQCRAASAGIGGMCSQAPAARSSNDALAYQPRHASSARKLRSHSTPKAPAPNDS